MQSTLEEKLHKNEDQRLIDFIHSVQRSSSKKLIMTTREYILNQAYQEYEKINRENFSAQKCIIDLDSYVRMNRAQILFNHIYFSNLPSSYREAILKNHSYLSIIDHRNYSPRIVQLLTEYTRLHNCPISEYIPFFLQSLENPLQVWEHAFEKHLSQAARNLLITLSSLPQECSTSELETAYNSFNHYYAQRFSATVSPQDFQNALKELDGDFLRCDNRDGKLLVDFTNPSTADFIKNYIQSHPAELTLLLNSIVFFEQLAVLWSWVKVRPLLNKNIKETPESYEKMGYRLLTTPNCRIITVRYALTKTERKEYWTTSFEERLSLLVQISAQTTDRLLSIAHKNVGSVKERISAGNYDRDGLADLIYALKTVNRITQYDWIDHLIESCVNALLNGVEWTEELRPLCQLIEKHPGLFSKYKLSRAADAVKNVAENLVNEEYFSPDVETLRADADELQSFAKIVSVDVEDIVEALRERANEQDNESSEDEDAHIEYSSYSVSNDEGSDQDIVSMFSTLKIED